MSQVFRRGFRQLASGTIISRILGLARDVCLAIVFGSGPAAAGFLLAFTIPNLFRRLLGEGALSEAAVPAFVVREESHGRASAFALVNRLLALSLVILAGGSLLALTAESAAAWLAVEGRFPAVVRAFLHKETTLTAVALLPLMMPYCIFICTGAFLGGVLNALNRFSVPALMPALLNVAFLAGIGYVAQANLPPAAGVRALTWAVLIGGALQLGAVLAALWREGWRPGLGSRDGVRAALRTMGVLAFGASIYQIGVLIDRTLAAWIGAHAVAGLYFAERLTFLPLGIVGVAVGSAMLGELARASTAGDATRASDLMSAALRLTVFFTLPATVFLVALAAPIVRVLFGYGAFDADSVHNTVIALVAYAPGIVVFTLAKPIRAAYLCRAGARTLAIVGIGSLVGNLVLNLLLMQILEHAGLALATVISSAVSQLVLLRLLIRSEPAYGRSVREALQLLLRLLPGVTAAAAAALALPYLLPSTRIGDCLAIALALLVGAPAYLAFARFLAPNTFREFTAILKKN